MSLFNYFNVYFCKSQTQKYKNQITYLNRRIESLTKSVSNSIKPISIKYKGQIIRPQNIIYDCIVADDHYYGFTLDEYKTILTQMYDELRLKEKYIPKVFDCDDFALIFSGSLAYSMFKSGYDKQIAFGIAWSNIHAFNIFVTKDNKVYLYEPQNNIIMEYSDNIKNNAYKVTKIWFMG